MAAARMSVRPACSCLPCLLQGPLWPTDPAPSCLLLQVADAVREQEQGKAMMYTLRKVGRRRRTILWPTCTPAQISSPCRHHTYPRLPTPQDETDSRTFMLYGSWQSMQVSSPSRLLGLPAGWLQALAHHATHCCCPVREP
jgi:hypothetical protein